MKSTVTHFILIFTLLTPSGYSEQPLSALNGKGKQKTPDLVASLEAMKPLPLAEVPSATLIKPNGGWCWFQGPRAIVTRSGNVVFTSISGDSYAGQEAGDLWATSWNPRTGATQHFELHDQLEQDDHNVAGLLEKEDGSILAVYGKHGTDRLQRHRLTTHDNTPVGSIASWSDEAIFKTKDYYTYSNVYALSAEKGRIYNFSRSLAYNPICSFSDDGGRTWKYGWQLMHWQRSDYAHLPAYTGVDGSRPYQRYVSNNIDTIHFVTTEDHPRAFDNSIYHGYYKAGKLHDSHGGILSYPASKDAKRLTPQSFTQIFQGGKDRVAWTADLALDAEGYPYTAFSVQVDGASTRGGRSDLTGNDHRYWYARFDGEKWHSHEIAHAGTKLYTAESDYTGLIALDPNDPNVAVISTNADPVTGKPLISSRNKKRHYELYLGKTADLGKTWKWQALTKNSAVDNLRPVIPDDPGEKNRYIIWCRGELKSFIDYRLDLCVMPQSRRE